MNTLLFIGGLGMWEVLLIFLVVLVLFGAKKIPELARGMGKGIREFKEATSDIQRDIETASKAPINQGHNATAIPQNNNTATTANTTDVPQQQPQQPVQNTQHTHTPQQS